MEKVSKKSVDRQATFDTDPSRARLTRGGLKLPVIEGKDKGKDNSSTKNSDNKTVQNKSKDIKSVTSDKVVENKSKSNKTTNESKETINASNKEHNKRESNEATSVIKPSETNRKSDILSNVNKKATASSNKSQIKDTGKPVDKSVEAKQSAQSEKLADDPTKTNKSGIINKGELTHKTYDKLNSKTNNSVSKSSPSHTKINVSKPPDKQEKIKEVKPQANHKHTTYTSNKDSKAIEVAKTNKPDAENPVKGRLSKSPEKLTVKATVLNEPKRKRSVSPPRGRNASPQKNSPPTNNESPGNKRTLKPQESNTPRNKDTSTNKSTSILNSKTDNDTTVLKQSQNHDSLNKDFPDNKITNTSSKIVDTSNQHGTKQTSHAIATKDNSKDDTSSDKRVEKTKKKNDEISHVNSSELPVNNAPSGTLLQKNEDRHTSVSPRYRQTNEQKVKSSSPKNIPNEAKAVPEERSEERNVNKQSESKTKVGSGALSITEELIEDEPTEDKLEVLSAVNEPNNIKNNLRIPPSGEVSFDDNDVTDKGLKTGVQTKHDTYVVSPSVSKLKTRSSRESGNTSVGRLSPTNETIEPIRADHKSDKAAMNGDRKESYAQVYAERNTLLKAEITYRKRIKQLEEEANGFLNAIEELTTENRYLRGRVDALEDEIRGKGDTSAIDKISELEREKADLENKLKRSEKASNSNKPSDEVRELKEQIIKLQSENQNVNDENAKLKSENHEVIKKLNSMNFDKRAYSKTDTSTEADKQNVKQIRDLNSKVQSLEKKVNTLEFENKMLSETLAQKKSELGELLGVMKDENKFDDEIKVLKEQVVKLTKEKKDAEQTHKKEKRQMNEKIQEFKMQLEEKGKDTDELKIKLDEREKENKRLKSTADTTKKLVESQKEEINRLKEENKRLNEEKGEFKEKYTTIITESKSATKDLGEAKDKLEQFNKDLQKVVSDKESQISKLINQLDTMREEREEQRKTASAEREKLLSEREKNDHHTKNIRRLETDLKHFVEKLDDAKVKEKTLTTDLEGRSFEVSNLEKQVFELNMKMENHSKRMNELDREKREMERDKREWDVKKDKLADIEASNKRLMEENKRLRNQIEMSSIGSQSDYRISDRPSDDQKVLEAWVSVKESPSQSRAIYVQNEKSRDKTKRVQLVQPSIQKKRQPFSKSSPVKQSRQAKSQEHKSGQNTHRSLEDLRKVTDARTPESEHSLPELTHDNRMTLGYSGLGGYREIHKNRIRAAAHKRIY